MASYRYKKIVHKTITNKESAQEMPLCDNIFPFCTLEGNAEKKGGLGKEENANSVDEDKRMKKSVVRIKIPNWHFSMTKSAFTVSLAL